jgi:glutathione S-transferase
MNDVFDKKLPEFMKKLLPNLGTTGFLTGDKLSVADFWIGGLYTNYFNNPKVMYAPERWAKAKVDNPEFVAYGERFAEANKEYLKGRGERPY